MSKRGPEQVDEALKWADVALDNRSRWSGDLHVRRVYALFRLKAMASQKQWTWREEQLAKDPSDAANEAVRLSRNQTMTLAREWLEYARSAGRDPTLAYKLCVSAAGTQDFCEG